jgi:hypothetical protein
MTLLNESPLHIKLLIISTLSFAGMDSLCHMILMIFTGSLLGIYYLLLTPLIGGLNNFQKPHGLMYDLMTMPIFKGEGIPRKLTTTTQPQFPKKIADFKQATGFQINRRTLRKFMFH